MIQMLAGRDKAPLIAPVRTLDVRVLTERPRAYRQE
jgi:hypothetical protein